MPAWTEDLQAELARPSRVERVASSGARSKTCGVVGPSRGVVGAVRRGHLKIGGQYWVYVRCFLSSSFPSPPQIGLDSEQGVGVRTLMLHLISQGIQWRNPMDSNGFLFPKNPPSNRTEFRRSFSPCVRETVVEKVRPRPPWSHGGPVRILRVERHVDQSCTGLGTQILYPILVTVNGTVSRWLQSRWCKCPKGGLYG